MNKQYTALAILALLVGAEANVLQVKTADVPALRNSAWSTIGTSADVNEYVDTTIEMLIPFMREHGLDPMPLPDIVEGFSVKFLLITYSAWLKITKGSMTGLVNIERSGDQMVNYFAKMLRLKLQFAFRDTQFHYNYLVQVMNIGPTGGIRATLSRFTVNVDLLIDFNNDEVHLQDFSLNEIGRLSIRFTGNILFDWLLTPVTNVFLAIFDSTIIKIVELSIRNGVNEGIAAINAGVKELIKEIEAYNY